MKQDIMNQIKSAQNEIELIKLSKTIENEINKNELFMEFIDLKYRDKLRDIELINNVKEKSNKLLLLINEVNKIEVQAIKIKDTELMMKCECKKTKLINLMEYMHNKYL
jgi:hypothetical protein